MMHRKDNGLEEVTMKFNFEQIDDHHQRAKVPGGWLVKAYESVTHYWGCRIAMAFVPDPNHVWAIDIKDCPDCAGICESCGWPRPADMLDDDGVCEICKEIESKIMKEKERKNETAIIEAGKF